MISITQSLKQLAIAKPLKFNLLQLQSAPCPVLSCYKSVHPDWLPEKPKRPATIYMAWVKDHHSSVKEKMPHAQPKDVIKQCSQQYKSVSDTVKEGYKRQRSQLLVDYKQRLNNYQYQMENLSGKQKVEYQAMLQEIEDKREKRKINGDKNKLKKMLHELGKPKRVKSPYQLFMIEYLQKQKPKGTDQKMNFFKEVIQDISKQWKGLSEKERQKYETVSEAAKEQYNKDLVKWENNMKRQGLPLLVGLSIRSLNEKSLQGIINIIETA